MWGWGFLGWLNRSHRLANDFEASIASAKAWAHFAPALLHYEINPPVNTTQPTLVRKRQPQVCPLSEIDVM